jgi:hypothetical protein
MANLLNDGLEGHFSLQPNGFILFGKEYYFDEDRGVIVEGSRLEINDLESEIIDAAEDAKAPVYKIIISDTTAAVLLFQQHLSANSLISGKPGFDGQALYIGDLYFGGQLYNVVVMSIAKIEKVFGNRYHFVLVDECFNKIGVNYVDEQELWEPGDDDDPIDPSFL